MKLTLIDNYLGIISVLGTDATLPVTASSAARTYGATQMFQPQVLSYKSEIICSLWPLVTENNDFTDHQLHGRC